jgi:hypothetical protein
MLGIRRGLRLPSLALASLRRYASNGTVLDGNIVKNDDYMANKRQMDGYINDLHSTVKKIHLGTLTHSLTHLTTYSLTHRRWREDCSEAQVTWQAIGKRENQFTG